MKAAGGLPSSPRGRAARSVRWEVACGAVAGPLFGTVFTVIGAARSDYDWRRHAVSSLACGRQGRWQRANFIATGVLWCAAARGLRRAPGRVAGPWLVPVVVGAAGAGLIGSGLFVTDPVGGFPPRRAGAETVAETSVSASAVRSRAGRLHNLSALPIFVGIPVAGLAAGMSAALADDYRWASYSVVSSLVMIGNFVLFGAAFAGTPRLAGRGGIFQRLSIASGFGWVTALSVRTLRALRQGQAA